MQDLKKTILIIEDEQPMQRILRDTLTENDYDSILAENGEEGLHATLKKHPDLILLDLLMPKMDGMMLLSKLREDEWGKNVPVIMLTNVSPDTESTLKQVITYQPAYYAIKSDTELKDLLGKIQDVLSSLSTKN